MDVSGCPPPPLWEFIRSLWKKLQGSAYFCPKQHTLKCTVAWFWFCFNQWSVTCDLSLFISIMASWASSWKRMETHLSLYRICPALMELRLNSGTYVCWADSSFSVPFSSASYIIHRFKAVLLCRRTHLLTWKSHRDQKAQHQGLLKHCSHYHWKPQRDAHQQVSMNNYQYFITEFFYIIM